MNYVMFFGETKIYIYKLLSIGSLESNHDNCQYKLSTDSDTYQEITITNPTCLYQPFIVNGLLFAYGRCYYSHGIKKLQNSYDMAIDFNTDFIDLKYICVGKYKNYAVFQDQNLDFYLLKDINNIIPLDIKIPYTCSMIWYEVNIKKLYIATTTKNPETNMPKVFEIIINI